MTEPIHISAKLLEIEKSLSDLADATAAKSIILGDEWFGLSDGCIDAMESVRVLRNCANDIERNEADTPPNALPVGMNHNG